MPKRRLRWGLICTARINRALIPAIRAAGRSELVAVASRDLARAQEYARQWEIPRAHGSYQALLADPDVDVIYNALPNHLHCAWTVRAADAGKHVLCEKPLALTVDEVDRVSEAARRNGVVVFEAFMYRHHPQTFKVQELIRRGAIGALRTVYATFSFTLDRPADPRLDAAMGGGALWDVGCYPVSFARAVVGDDPAEVFGWQATGPSGVDLTFAGQMRFAGGALAQIACGFQAAFHRGAEIAGSEGVITLEDPWKPGADSEPGVTLRHGDDVEWLPVEDVGPPLCEVRAMEACVLDGAPPIVSLADSHGNTATINGLYESARTGKPVTL
jgi:predicted dehydrogenase